jgi:hypothetical protein
VNNTGSGDRKKLLFQLLSKSPWVSTLSSVTITHRRCDRVDTRKSRFGWKHNPGNLQVKGIP